MDSDMDLQESLRTIIEADEETVEHLDDGIIKDVCLDVRDMADGNDENLRIVHKLGPNNSSEPPEDKGNELFVDYPDDHQSRSDYFDDTEKVSNWLFSSIRTALLRSDISGEAIHAVVDEAVRSTSWETESENEPSD